jgi:hypothetical protein
MKLELMCHIFPRRRKIYIVDEDISFLLSLVFIGVDVDERKER